MGVQIYIDKAAIQHLIEYHDIDTHVECNCGMCDGDSTYGRYCRSCDSPIQTHSTEYYKYQGLDRWMIDFKDKVYHDANTWGSSRELILDWLNKHSISEKHYYFA